MRLPLFVSACCLAPCLLAGTSAADEALDAVFKAGQALQAAPVVRMTETTTDTADPAKSAVSVTDKIKPLLIHLRQERAGKREIDIISDGRRSVIRLGPDSEFEDGGWQVGRMMADIRFSIALPLVQNLKGEVLPAARMAHLQAAGHEFLGGKPATVYTCWEERDAVVLTEKFWISDADSLPLKYVREFKGENIKDDGPAEHVDKSSEIIFDYDPAIKIVLPEPKLPEPEKKVPEVTTPETAISFALPPAAFSSLFLCAFSFSTVFPASAAT